MAAAAAATTANPLALLPSSPVLLGLPNVISDSTPPMAGPLEASVTCSSKDPAMAVASATTVGGISVFQLGSDATSKKPQKTCSNKGKKQGLYKRDKGQTTMEGASVSTAWVAAARMLLAILYEVWQVFSFILTRFHFFLHVYITTYSIIHVNPCANVTIESLMYWVLCDGPSNATKLQPLVARSFCSARLAAALCRFDLRPGLFRYIPASPAKLPPQNEGGHPLTSLMHIMYLWTKTDNTNTLQKKRCELSDIWVCYAGGCCLLLATASTSDGAMVTDAIKGKVLGRSGMMEGNSWEPVFDDLVTVIKDCYLARE